MISSKNFKKLFYIIFKKYEIIYRRVLDATKN